MANWIYRLDLKDLWQKRDDNKLTIEELAKLVAKRIEKLPCYKKYKKDLLGIVLDFENCFEDVEEFDSILENLYDWADTPLPTPYGQMQKKLCWVATF